MGLIYKDISNEMKVLDDRIKNGCFKEGYQCVYVDKVKSLTRSTRNINAVCLICDKKRV